MAASRQTTSRVSGERPTGCAAARSRQRPAATIARWPVDVDDGFESAPERDAAVAVVRRSIADYRAGRSDRAAQSWHEDIAWRVVGEGPLSGEWVGREEVFGFHRLAERLTDGDFHQQLIALEGSHGAIVNAHLRTTASRRGRRLDVPTLLVFELAGGRIRSVTEIPGDGEAWRRFWSD